MNKHDMIDKIERLECKLECIETELALSYVYRTDLSLYRRGGYKTRALKATSQKIIDIESSLASLADALGYELKPRAIEQEKFVKKDKT